MASQKESGEYNHQRNTIAAQKYREHDQHKNTMAAQKESIEHDHLITARMQWQHKRNLGNMTSTRMQWQHKRNLYRSHDHYKNTLAAQTDSR